jgi:hypothetical protein
MEQRDRLALARPVDVLHERLDQPLRLLSAQQRGHRAQHHRRAAPALEPEAQAFERGRPLLHEPGLARAQLDRLREQQLLRGQRARVELAKEPLEQHALVRHVLVDEEHLVVARGDDEGVLQLPDDLAEARRGREGSRRLAEQ